MVSLIGIERQGQVVRLRDTNRDRATRTVTEMGQRQGQRWRDRDVETGAPFP